MGIRGKEIISIGTVNGESVSTKAVLEIQISPTFPTRAAVTANNPIATNGNMILDGREHDLNGNVISNAGTLSLSAAQTYQRHGNSQVAGTYNGVDEPLTKTGFSNIVEENASWDEGFPATPDQYMGGVDMGFPEGTLKQLAISGANGGQYAIDPNNLTFPLRGATYVELPDGGVWDPVFFGESSGILVVHNSQTNAKLENLNGTRFRGLIIVDDLVHIHCPSIGALAILSSNPSGGNCIGNGSGSVLFSSSVLTNVAESAGATEVEVDLASWYE